MYTYGPTESQKHDIEESISNLDRMLWCGGVRTVPSDMLQLFYKTRTTSGGSESEKPAVPKYVDTTFQGYF